MLRRPIELTPGSVKSRPGEGIKPCLGPRLPVIVGGHSPSAFRRASRFGQGWYGFGLDPRLTARLLEGLDAALEARGRSREDLEVLVTPVRDSVDLAREFQDLGVDRLIVHLGSQRPEKLERRLEALEALVAAVDDGTPTASSSQSGSR
jgi:alkanesulfonate monooxygenase SsuD/methylene tetrahydromethanopterin reductase-like flavin-dependent oxidoreductase (luciferase family)